jgi:hypothetical protein
MSKQNRRNIWAALAAVLTLSSILLTVCGCAGSRKPASSPVISPDGGSYTSAQTVTIIDATSGASIYYTADGSAPTASSTHYTGPITVSSTSTISAIATATGYSNSAVATATYTIETGPTPSAADAYFSPLGADSFGATIGIDCTYPNPCKTVTKALSFLASNIAGGAGANHNYVLRFDAGNGPFALSSKQILNSAHTVASGYTTTFDVYNGTQAAWSGGVDTAGTWTSVTLPNGGSAQGCRSSYLTGLAPLTGTNVKSYVGVAWINGHRVQETIRPGSGSAWAQIPGTCTVSTCTDTGSSVFTGPIATFTPGSTSIQISDMSKVGVAGETIAFDSAVAGLQASWHPYFILASSGTTGSGTITISDSGPGGAAITANASATSNVTDPVVSQNAGDRSGYTAGISQFAYDPSAAEFLSSYNQNDVKGELEGDGGPGLAPVAAVSGGYVTLNSRLSPDVSNASPTVGYRVWNRFENLGSGGYSGEIYTDRSTGYVYYTPRTDLGETCSALNTPGTAIFPSTLETLVEISSSQNDINLAGVGTAGAAVGNMIFNHILIEYTNTSVFTGTHDMAGDVGGFVNEVTDHYAGPMEWAFALIGASNVTFNSVEMAHFGGAALAVGWGSNHDTVENSSIHDVGGTLITAGAASSWFDSYQYQSDAGYSGTTIYGPTTPGFASANNKDLSGVSDCCQTFSNNSLHDGGLVNPNAGCITLTGWQQFQVTHNTMHDCGAWGFVAGTDTAVSSTPPSLGIIGAIVDGSTTYYPYYSNVFTYNEIYNCGYETATANSSKTPAWTRTPGGAMGNDFGCFYISGPQDGDGTDPSKVLQIHFNKVHDISAAAYPVVQSGGQPLSNGYDAILDYHDGNDSNGINETNNLFYNRSAAAVGAPTYPTRLTQHTGNLRAVIQNNIFAGVFPSGAVIWDQYVPRTDVAPIYAIPPATSNYIYAAGDCSNTCYILSGYNVYSSTFTGSETTGNNTPPTCTGGSCMDGGVAWTFVETLPGNPYLVDSHNITAYEVPGKTGMTTDYVFLANNYTSYPQYAAFSNNLYSMAGADLTYYSGSVTFPQMQATQGATGSLEELNSLYANGILPNFVSLETGNFTFNPSYSGPGTAGSCTGTGTGTVSPACRIGFVPWDYSNVGQQ